MDPAQGSPTRVGDRAVGAAMHHDRRRAHLLEQRAHVHPVSELQQGRRRSWPARTRADRARIAAAPRRPPRRRRRRQVRATPNPSAHALRRRSPRGRTVARSMVRVRTPHTTTADPPALETARRTRSQRPHRRAPDQGGAIEPQLVHDGAQQSDLIVDCQRSRIELAVRHTRPRMVVADQRVTRCGRPPERPERLVAPVQFEMAAPPGSRHQRRPLTADRERDPRASEPQEPDSRRELRHLTRRLLWRPRTDPPRARLSGFRC